MKAVQAEGERLTASDGARVKIAPSLTSAKYPGVGTRQNTIEASRAVVLSSASVLAWRADHGVFPKTLARAMGYAPEDPFDGKPLRYRREPRGFVVYSVGPSCKFDGGTPRARPDRREVLFRYPLPDYLR